MHGRLAALATTAAAALAAGTAATAAPEPAAAQGGVTRPALERVVLQETNRVRVRHRLPALRRSLLLTRPARAHSRDLVARGRLSHEGRGGAPFWTRLVAAGFPRTRWMAENLAMLGGCGQDTARRAVRMWLRSPGHRRNLLGPRFRLVGVGAVSAPGCLFTVFTADYGSR